jgi:hypothetical protein
LGNETGSRKGKDGYFVYGEESTKEETSITNNYSIVGISRFSLICKACVLRWIIFLQEIIKLELTVPV